MTASAQATAQPRSLLTRALFFFLGTICLIGVAFSFLPGIPTADLVVLALFFYSRSSPRFEAWLRSRPIIQRILNRYEGGLTRGTKIQATVGILFSLGISAGFLTDSVTIRSILGFVGIFAIWFVWSRPGKAVTQAAITT
ncbi:MAG: YbaN family protein [Acidimicrobiia bacterium]